MSNSQIIQPFRMLIGDDAFEEQGLIEDYLTNILIGVRRETGCTEKIKPLILENGIYRTSFFPIKGFENAEFKAVKNSEELVTESNGNYHWIVSDLNYGRGLEEAGTDVILRVNPPNTIKAIFTSEDKLGLLRRIQSTTGLDYLVAPLLEENQDNRYEHKSNLLGRVIARHYSQKQNGGSQNE